MLLGEIGNGKSVTEYISLSVSVFGVDVKPLELLQMENFSTNDDNIGTSVCMLRDIEIYDKLAKRVQGAERARRKGVTLKLLSFKI